MKILVCGGRDYNNRKVVDELLSSIHSQETITEIIHGAARGADTLGGLWAKRNNIPVREFPADWNKNKKAAGHIRNIQMLKEGQPDAVVAFPGGSGTNHMITIAEKEGLIVLKVPENYE